MKKLISLILSLVMVMTAACALADVSGSVSLNGSTSMEKVVGVLSEQFMLDHPGVTVTYDATGSGTGISAAQQGTADIGLASRGLKEAETGLHGGIGRHCRDRECELRRRGYDRGADR